MTDSTVDNRYSITSNEVKLYKHLDSLQALQSGQPKPIMVHISPTNRCNRRCIHCCFDNRDKTLEMNWDLFASCVTQFYKLGVRALEFTGGGEPTTFTHINKAIELCHSLGIQLGINTNGMSVHNISDNNWEKFTWVRIASNIFDGATTEELERFEQAVLFLQDRTKLTSCYIVPKQIGLVNLGRVVEFANKHRMLTRIAPDCIATRQEIRTNTDTIKRALAGFYTNEFCFCSDFNVYLFDREDDVCLVHTIKPFVYTDGWVYCCPSSELAIENGATMNEKLRVCRIEDITRYYQGRLEVFHHKCSYCKYAQQNEILNAVIKETTDNAFA
jgi:organic radical activating enzyme